MTGTAQEIVAMLVQKQDEKWRERQKLMDDYEKTPPVAKVLSEWHSLRRVREAAELIISNAAAEQAALDAEQVAGRKVLPEVVAVEVVEASDVL